MKQTAIKDYVLNVPLTNDIGTFSLGVFQVEVNGVCQEIYTLMYGEQNKIANVRINSACFTSDIFGCQRCDCNEQLREALKFFVQSGNGLLIYDVSQEGRGIGAVAKLQTLKLMDEKGCSTAEAFMSLGYKVDTRNYNAAVEVLKFLKINKINLITNNPDKVESLRKMGITVIKRTPTISKKVELQAYLLSKEKDMGHIISDEKDKKKQ